MPHLITASDVQASAILGAMRDVATARGRYDCSGQANRSLRSAGRYIFHRTDTGDAARIPVMAPKDLAGLLSDHRQAEVVTRFLAVTALIDGELNRARIETVLAYADVLGVREDYVHHLERSIEGDLHWVLNDMSRQNILSLWNEPWDESVDINDIFMPYKGANADPALATRYPPLEQYAQGTVGRAFWEIYHKNGYAFPGEEQAINGRFATPHDSSHVVSGYDTSPRGEILVSTFTAGMHPVRPMEGHILPVIYSWHLNIKINDVAGAAKDHLDVEAFWEAWVRGAHCTEDLFSRDWDFWAVAHEPIHTVRERYGVTPLSEH